MVTTVEVLKEQEKEMDQGQGWSFIIRLYVLCNFVDFVNEVVEFDYSYDINLR